MMTDNLLFTLTPEQQWKLITAFVQEHVGYNCPVSISHGADNHPNAGKNDRVGACKVAPCPGHEEYEDGAVLFSSGSVGVVKVTLLEDYDRYCTEQGIVPF